MNLAYYFATVRKFLPMAIIAAPVIIATQFLTGITDIKTIALFTLGCILSPFLYPFWPSATVFPTTISCYQRLFLKMRPFYALLASAAILVVVSSLYLYMFITVVAL